MTEMKHPNWLCAERLAESPRFCEFLDATSRHSSRWPHNRTTAASWLRDACQVESLGALGVDPVAAARLAEVEQRFMLWDQNEELAL
ncbi:MULTISPECIES: hypothetical protein [unclassified Halomonas]|uniref:hypothetical protein n=1 Tax=unclassified Halomonas TaxID=2609666 RepID=UPI002886E587|nr:MULTISPECIES: hypothetical protein [unclassified Halomonas]MDT0499691.1 hypothetical protein [Halomonas sp. PAR7]MDT0510492.1 hypothetical protein [Halomonas sp. LES1]MDT0589799.1 hypothetical protein [Halomonas sp. PAR8]